MAAKYDPTEYEAIHSTYEDNLVYRDDANYIASLESISMKTSHCLDRMSRDSQLVASDFIPRTAASVRSRKFYNLECSPESSGIAGGSRANRRLRRQVLRTKPNFRVADHPLR